MEERGPLLEFLLASLQGQEREEPAMGWSARLDPPVTGQCSKHLEAQSGCSAEPIRCSIPYPGPVRIGPLELWEDPSSADWIVDRIHAFAEDVGSVIPDGFAAYCRVFHPAARFGEAESTPVRWSEIAAVNGRVVHPEMQWPNISGEWEHSGETTPGLWDHEPDVGTLPRSLASRLVGLLTAYTSTPDRVWFCVWEGWGALRVESAERGPGYSASARPLVHRRRLPGRPAGLWWWRRTDSKPRPATVELPGRSYHLLRGPITAATESMEAEPLWQSANLWWPDDQTWCVATEIDFAWTYVGGSEACVRALLDAPDLEALATDVGHRITYAADRINPWPDCPRP